MDQPVAIVAPPRSTGRFPPALLFFSIGFTAELAQVVLFRELLTTFSGSEIAIGLILGTWLLWTAAGSFLAHVLSPSPDTPEEGRGEGTRGRRDYRWFVAATVLVCAALPLEIVGIRLLRAWCGVAVGGSIPVSLLFLWSLVLLAPLGLGLGAQFVLGSRLVAAPESVYVAESVGSAAGGFLVSFLLVPAMDSFSLAFLAAIVHLVLAGMLGRWRAAARPDPPRRYLPFALWPLLGVIALCPLAGTLDDATRQAYWRVFFPSDDAGAERQPPRLVASCESAYGSIAVLEAGDEHTVYQSGRRTLTLSRRPQPAPGTHLCLAQHPGPQRVLLMGGGIAGSLRHILLHHPQHVDYVEIDPVLVDVARQYVSAEDQAALGNASVSLHATDGRAFLRQSADRYDVIMVHAPEPTTAQDNRFYTLEFFQEARRRLNDGGVLCIGEVPNETAGMLDDVLLRNATIRATLAQVFADVLVTAGENCYFLASPAPGLLTTDAGRLWSRLSERGIQRDAVDLNAYLDPSGLEKARFELTTGEAYNPISTQTLALREWPINTDLRPELYYRSIRIRARVDGDQRLLWAMDFVERLPLGWWLAGLGAVLAGSLIGVPGRRHRSLRVRALCFGAFASGLTGMAMEIMVLFAFQNARGSIYQSVGAIMGVFMLGLAAGAEAARRMGPRSRFLRRVVIVQAAFALFALAMPWLLIAPMRWGSPAAQTLAFAALNLLTGTLVGLFFPLAVKSAREAGGRDASGPLYASDLLGGAIGALLAGTLCLPLFGMVTMAVACAILSATGALALAWAARGRRLGGSLPSRMG